MKFAIYFLTKANRIFKKIIDAEDFFDAIDEARSLFYTDTNLKEIVRINRIMVEEETKRKEVT